MNSRYVATLAEANFNAMFGPCSWNRPDAPPRDIWLEAASSVLTALIAELRADPRAVEAMMQSVTGYPRRQAVQSMLNALCDYLGATDA